MEVLVIYDADDDDMCRLNLYTFCSDEIALIIYVYYMSHLVANPFFFVLLKYILLHMIVHSLDEDASLTGT